MESTLPLWITEDITWPFLWGLLATGGLAFLWFFTRQLLFMIATLVVATLLVLIVAVELTVVTDKEYILDSINQMAEYVRRNEPEGIVQFVHPENEKFRGYVNQTMARYDFRSCNINGFSGIDIDPESTSPRMADVRFSVWATGNLAGRLDTLDQGIVAVELEFRNVDGRWYVENCGYRPGNSLGEYRSIRE